MQPLTTGKDMATASNLCAHPAKLYGDDLSLPELEKWYADEENGYAELGYLDSDAPGNPYRHPNKMHGWSRVSIPIGSTLSLGGAFGAEFEEIARHIDRLTIIKPARRFWRESAYGLRLEYVQPSLSGDIPFPDAFFDTVTAFGVLHHIPNVSHVFSELVRVLKPSGNLLIREPIISMGDWRSARPGLTKHERGIPPTVFESLVSRHGLMTISSSMNMFSPLQKVCGYLGVNLWSRPALIVDNFLCSVLKSNHKYHRTSFRDKFAPSSMFLVLRKSANNAPIGS
jgi:hypothetical protein